MLLRYDWDLVLPVLVDLNPIYYMAATSRTQSTVSGVVDVCMQHLFLV